MEEYFNRLTPAQLERLACLDEEMHEVGQVVGKIVRHGYEGTHPDGGPTNRELLEEELGHLFFAIEMMHARDVDYPRIWASRSLKAKKVGQYLHHNEVTKEMLS